MRELNEEERRQVRALTRKSIDFTLIQPTKTGLRKYTLDATGPVRTYLREKHLHEYQHQAQGQENRRELDAVLLQQDRTLPSIASLYRPKSKDGDPRIWFSDLGRIAAPDDILAIIADDGKLSVLNISQTDIASLSDMERGPIGEFIARLNLIANSIPEELLQKLRILARKGPLISVMDERADTAIGRTIESALGIPMNSSREPDYKGIELKSARSKRNRAGLFAQVPDWPDSVLKSSAAILDAFGYDTPEGRRLYCTVSTRKPNPRSLYLEMNRDLDKLDERSTRASLPSVATWRLDTLRAALVRKHSETFWITADSSIAAGREKFQLRSVCHTRAPILPQFELLLEQGEITMDHLIKRSTSGRLKEKGPLFKVSRRSFPLLFPPSKNYDLISRG